MKTKHEIDKELKYIKKELKDIKNILYWYLEIPTIKLIKLGVKEGLSKKVIL